jgi:hypothetical protein
MSLSATDHVATLVAAVILSSCRFGGPSGDPTLPVVDGAGGFAESGEQADRDGNGGQAGRAGNGGTSGETGGTTGGSGGANTGGSAGSTADASHDIADDLARDTSDDAELDGALDGDAGLLDTRADASFDGESRDSEPPMGCLPPFSSAVCDPVCNTGCPALFRCDITDMARTGVCVGTLLSTVPEGMACTRSLATDDCLERLSCIDRICRRLCYRDTDCTTGTCCTVAIEVDGGPSGYRSCAPCGP